MSVSFFSPGQCMSCIRRNRASKFIDTNTGIGFFSRTGEAVPENTARWRDWWKAMWPTSAYILQENTFQRCADFFPLKQTKRISASSMIRLISLATGFRIVASDEPVISQLARVSHTATLFWSNISLFSCTVTGTSQPNKLAVTFQNRFCGWP